MAKMKFCDIGQHEVTILWKARTKVQQSCCKNCLGKYPKKATEEQKKDIVAKNVFFASQALVFPGHCENCHRPLNSPDKRSLTCHILPKKKGHGGFPSVAIHPQNKVFMCCYGGCYGHGDWDNRNAADRKTMPVYKLALERFREFEDVLTTDEKRRAYKYLGLD